MLKNRLIRYIAIGIFLFSFTGCKAKKADLSGRVKISNTIFPLYDWTGVIIGKNDTATLNSLVAKSGLNIHQFTPSQTDLEQISSADLIICTGTEIDAWALKKSYDDVINQPKILNLSDVLREKYQNEGSEPLSDHIWLSLKNAGICVQAICNALCELRPGMAEYYTANANAYIEELSALDASFKSVAAASPNKTLIICDTPAFSNLQTEYGFVCHTLYENCPAETFTQQQADEKIRFLAKELTESQENAILCFNDDSKKLAQNVIQAAKKPTCDILVLDIMENTSLRQAFNGKAYISVMRENLTNIQKAVNSAAEKK